MKSTLTSLTLLIAAGCAGDLDVRTDSGGNPVPVRLDSGVPPVTYDTGAPLPDTGPPADSTPTSTDVGVADMPPPQPDTAPGQSGPGGPCPCANGALCISGTCRATCTPTGTCDVNSGCAAAESCVPTTKGTHICMPAVAPGAACDASTFCPNGYLCASFNNGAYACRKTCTNPGGACG
ncbi:MAG: hypothetical protein KC503_30920, partial [Myxococcales bacterium]|nr:hypothetical protein [Myxococcales bacterium]